MNYQNVVTKESFKQCSKLSFKAIEQQQQQAHVERSLFVHSILKKLKLRLIQKV